MDAMIFAAGLGTRLKPLTDTMPKALVPLSGKPLLQWQIEQLHAAGISSITVNVHHLPEQIIDFLSRHYPDIRISDERDALLDTGGGLYQMLRSRADTTTPVLALNVDILSNIDLPSVVAAYQPNDLGLLVVSERVTQRYLCFDSSDRLIGWTNIATGEMRPDSLSDNKSMHHPLKRLAFSGMQILSPRIVRYMQAIHRQAFSLIDLYLYIVQHAPQEVLRAYAPSHYKMMDVGKTAHLPEAELFAESLKEGTKGRSE